MTCGAMHNQAFAKQVANSATKTGKKGNSQFLSVLLA
jgi:hypothetical protein